MRKYIADLHIHTLLSPCAEVEMTPRLIIQNAVTMGIDMIAITDHNASENVQAALEIAKQYDITVIPGMELQTREEIHVICLFPDLKTLEQWQIIVNEGLPDLKNNEDIFGPQFIVDAQDELIAVDERMLLASVNVSVEDAVARVQRLGGICIAAHVDRPAYSVISQLGFIPDNVSFCALETSRRTMPEDLYKRFPMTQSFPIVTASDAHRLSELVSPKTLLYINEPTFAELKLALQGQNGRKVVVEPPRG